MVEGRESDLLQQKAQVSWAAGTASLFSSLRFVSLTKDFYLIFSCGFKAYDHDRSYINPRNNVLWRLDEI